MITYTLDEKSRKRLVLCTLGEEDDFTSSLSLPNSEHGSERKSPFFSSGQTGTGEEEFFLTSSMESDTASEMCRVMSLLTSIGKASWEVAVNFSSHDPIKRRQYKNISILVPWTFPHWRLQIHWLKLTQQTKCMFSIIKYWEVLNIKSKTQKATLFGDIFLHIRGVLMMRGPLQ